MALSEPTLGIALALLGTASVSLADAGKKRLTESCGPYFVAWSTAAAGLALNLSYLAYTGLPPLDWSKLWVLILLGAALIAASELLFLAALKGSEISLIMPFKCFGPIFAIPISFLLLGELPNWFAALGVLLTISGSYLMFVDQRSKGGFLAPFTALFHQRGPRLMIASILVFPLLGSLQKLGSEASSSIFFFTALLLAQFTFFGALLLITHCKVEECFRSAPYFILVVALTWAIGVNAIFLSFQYTLVVYVAAVLQLQPLFTIPIAYWYFGERDSLKRTVPALVMVLGVTLVVIAQ